MVKLIVLLVLGSMRLCCLEPYKVSSVSMEPGFPIGTILIVDKTAFRSHRASARPNRGEVVVFVNPENDGERWVKRVVGMPGDVIALRDRILSVNGHQLTADVICDAVGCVATDVFEGRDVAVSYRIESSIRGDGEWRSEDGYFLMGDNRDNAYDSRFFEAVPASALKGYVVAQVNETTLIRAASVVNALAF